MSEKMYGVGSKIKAKWLQANPKTSLSGMQLKFGATYKEVEGTIVDIRGDHPTAPTVIQLIVSTDSGEEIVDPKNVVEILD